MWKSKAGVFVPVYPALTGSADSGFGTGDCRALLVAEAGVGMTDRHRRPAFDPDMGEGLL